MEYIRLFEEFRALQGDGLKVSYCVAFLAEKYHISVRKVYDLIKKFKANAKCLHRDFEVLKGDRLIYS